MLNFQIPHHLNLHVIIHKVNELNSMFKITQPNLSFINIIQKMIKLEDLHSNTSKVIFFLFLQEGFSKYQQKNL